jgi:cell division protein FtsL
MPEQPDRRSPGRPRQRVGRRDGGRSLRSKLAILVLVPLGLYALYTVVDKSVQTYRLRQEAAVVRAEIEAEQRENVILQQEVVSARSDQQIEDAARRHLNLVKPGDSPVVLVSSAPPPTATPRPATQPTPVDEPPPWLSWLLERLRR